MNQVRRPAGRPKRPPVGRPTIASAQRESLNVKSSSAVTNQSRPSSSTQTDENRQKAKVVISEKRKPIPYKKKAISETKIPVLNKEKDWTKEKVIQTRSKQQLNGNLEFYQNKLQSKPGGHQIEDMLKWEKNYDTLERNHRYIQWLFPLPGSHGMNPQSQPLQEHEAMTISTTRQLTNRVLRAYKMMLDFYGMELVSKDTGEITRARNWKARYSHLNRSFHNYLRICRIIKSLGCLGFEHFQYPWLQFILEEAVVSKELSSLDCRSVFHWINALSNKSEQQKITEYYKQIKKGEPTDDNVDMEEGEDDELFKT